MSGNIAKMRKAFGYQLLAYGRKGLPDQIEYNQTTYNHTEVLKHDFFAATGLYEIHSNSQSSQNSNPQKIILKINRQQHFLFLPLFLLGWFLSSHEISILKHLKGLDGVPRFLSRFSRTGFLYEYIEGRSLDEQNKLPDRFFDELLQLIQRVHLRNIVYFDLNKRGNILIGTDGKPHIIDFQTSVHIGPRFLIAKNVTTYIRNKLQKTDVYHLFKHKRRFRPDLLTADEKVLAYCTASRLILIHRLIANPYRKLRRALLKFLYTRGFIIKEKNSRICPENDPARFLK